MGNTTSQSSAHIIDVNNEVSKPAENASTGEVGKRNDEQNVQNTNNETAVEYINLSKVLMEEYNAELSLATIDAAISLFRQALEVCPTDHSHYADVVIDLASALGMRFLHTNQITDLNESLSLRGNLMEEITCGRVTLNVGANPASTDQDAQRLLQTAKQNLQDFRQSGPLHAANSVIFLLWESLTLPPIDETLQFVALTTLAEGLYARFEHSNDISDLHGAISCQEDALKCCSRARETQWRQQSLTVLRLCAMLAQRFDLVRNTDDLRSACLNYESIIKPGAIRENVGLFNLKFANDLWQQFGETGDANDLNQAVEVFREANTYFLAGSEGDTSSLNNLANALGIRFRQGGPLNDLEEAIALHRYILKLRPPPHTDRHYSLNNLGTALSMRFEERGERNDLDEAILLHRQALELQAPAHPLRPSVLDNLGKALLTRFYDARQRNDLDEAILLHEQALQLRNLTDPDRSLSLNNLGCALHTRFRELGRPADLDDVISRHREALKLRPAPHPLRHSSLHNLSVALIARDRSNPEDQKSDLDEAILLTREALDAQPSTHPRRSGTIVSLADALTTRLQKKDQDIQGDDFYEAISLYNQALNLQAPPNPDRPGTLRSLAIGLMLAHLAGQENSEYVDMAMSSFYAALQCSSDSGSAYQRFTIAKAWSDGADQFQHPSAMIAYDAALQLLPQIAALSLDVQSRHRALVSGSDGLARKAARCFIRYGNVDRAIEYLEAGRAIFWSQILHLRSPFDQLHDISPGLEEKLHILAAALERGSHRDTYGGMLDNREKLKLEEETSILARYDKEWSKTIEEVRKLTGFEDFLKPRGISSLLAAAAERPVVILLANDDSSNCIIMTSTSGRCISLPNLPSNELRRLVYLTQAAASHTPVWTNAIEGDSEDTVASPVSRHVQETLRIWLASEEGRGMRYETHGQISSDDIFRSVLKTLWNEVVKPVVDFLKLQKLDQPPVLQWCPTGLFTFLPLHAAGCYENPSVVDCASDYFVSSYSPTIGVLLEQDDETDTSSEQFRMMAVIDSKRLPGAEKELRCIKMHVPHDCLVELGTTAAPANVDAVFSRLPIASIVHFACHGKQDKLKPLQSALLLEDGSLTISKIMQQPLPKGSIAFLSACETAMGDEHLPDEAMSIGASLLFSGFRSVIATMWEMKDEDGPTVANTFYELLFRGIDGEPTRQPDTSKSAQALHSSVKKLRSEGASFRRWIPFIHMGR